MMIHNHFVGVDERNSELTELLGADDQEKYEKNLKLMGDDWYYKDKSFTYSINDNGHRCKNINEIDLNNYILFAGCSHTFGVGLELETTYAYLVSNKLGCDYYNLSIGGSGIDVLEHNLLLWFGKIKQKPKLVIIQMPDHTRFAGYNPYISIGGMHLTEKGSWVEDKDEIEMVVNNTNVGLYDARKLLIYSLIENVIDVPYIRANIWAQDNFSPDGIKMRGIDKARDLSHLGVKSNEKFADDIVNYIKQEHPNLNNTAE